MRISQDFIREALLTRIPVPLMEEQQLRGLIRSIEGLQLAPPRLSVSTLPLITPSAAVPLPPDDPATLRLAAQTQAFRELQQWIDETSASMMAANIEGERFQFGVSTQPNRRVGRTDRGC